MIWNIIVVNQPTKFILSIFRRKTPNLDPLAAHERTDIEVTDEMKQNDFAEEIGHNKYTVGDITDQSVTANRKQENYSRLYAYNLRIGLHGLLRAFKAHCQTTSEIADYIEVSEDFLLEALERYRQIYGNGCMLDEYYIRFEPNLQILTYYST